MRTVNEDSAEDFLTHNAGWLIRVAYLLTGDKAAAEDLAQDTLLKVYENWPKVAQSRHSKAYAKRVLVNLFLSGQRRPLVAVPRAAVDREAFEDQVTGHLDILAALGTLSSRQRAAITLRFYEDMTDREIAQSLGCSRATVRSLVFRGLRRLSSHLEPGSAPERRKGASSCP